MATARAQKFGAKSQNTGRRTAPREAFLRAPVFPDGFEQKVSYSFLNCTRSAPAPFDF